MSKPDGTIHNKQMGIESGYVHMTQKNYFGGNYIGCDIKSGLGLPDWEQLFKAYRVPAMRIGKNFDSNEDFVALFEAKGPAAFLVSIDPEQTYFPKIMSRVTENGTMESNPLHQMSPDLPEHILRNVTYYLS